MLTIIERLDRTFAKATDEGEPAAEALLIEADIRAFDEAVEASPLIQDPVIPGRGYKGVPITETAAISHVRTVGSARFGWRPRSIELADAGGPDTLGAGAPVPDAPGPGAPAPDENDPPA